MFSCLHIYIYIIEADMYYLRKNIKIKKRQIYLENVIFCAIKIIDIKRDGEI